MTEHRFADGLKKLYLRSDSKRHRYFAGFFNVPVLHRHGTILLYGDSDTLPHLVAFFDTLGIQRTYSRLEPPASSRGTSDSKIDVWATFTIDSAPSPGTRDMPVDKVWVHIGELTTHRPFFTMNCISTNLLAVWQIFIFLFVCFFFFVYRYLNSIAECFNIFILHTFVTISHCQIDCAEQIHFCVRVQLFGCGGVSEIGCLTSHATILQLHMWRHRCAGGPKWRSWTYGLAPNAIDISWVNWLFNVTINDISVIYVTAHRCAGGLKKKFDLRSGSQRHRHFVGFFNVPVLAPTRDHPFYTVIPTHRPI